MTSIQPDGRVEFRFYRPDATEVKVVGTFNAWNHQALPMSSAGDGWWIAETYVEAGEHHFRYIADGHWYTDFAANGVVKNKYGWNSILLMPERSLRLPMPIRISGDNDESQAIAA